MAIVSGVFFILIVMYAPGGIASILMMNLRLVKFSKFAASGQSCGTVGFILDQYRRSGAGHRDAVSTFSRINTKSCDFHFWYDIQFCWWRLVVAIALLTLATGVAGFVLFKAPFQKVWGEVNTEIEEAMRRAQVWWFFAGIKRRSEKFRQR
jgi:branched-chain amino acid transport system permease protein